MNITKQTEKYISEHPSVKDCLKKRLVNYSSLTRLIADELNIDLKKNFDAILIACRRYAEKLRKAVEAEKNILEILKKSKLEVRNKIIAAVIEKDVNFRNIIELEKGVKEKNHEVMHVIEGANAVTIITSLDFLDEIKDNFKNKILKINRDLVEIIVKSPSELENIPGVTAYLYSLFGEHGINIVETMSCYTDTIFVIKEEDLGKAVSALKI